MIKNKKLYLFFVLFNMLVFNYLAAVSIDPPLKAQIKNVMYGVVIFGVPYHEGDHHAATVVTYYLINQTRKQVKNLFDYLKMSTSFPTSVLRIPQKYIYYSVNGNSYDFTYLFEPKGTNTFQYSSYKEEYKKTIGDTDRLNKIYNWLLFVQQVYQNNDSGMNNVKDFWLNYVKNYDGLALVISGKLDISEQQDGQYDLEIKFTAAFPDGYAKQNFPKDESTVNVDDPHELNMYIGRNVSRFFTQMKEYIIQQ